MTDQSQDIARGDQMTTDFFENILTEYLEDDRIESGVVRLELDDGRTRRVVIDDDTESLDTYEYVQRELAEISYLIAENEELLDEPLELSIPVEDADRVIDEVEEDGAVSTLFQTGGVQTLVDHLQTVLEAKSEDSNSAVPSSE